MKKQLLLATAMASANLAPVWAGGMAEPAMDTAVVQAATVASSHDVVVPLMLLLVIAATLSD